MPFARGYQHDIFVSYAHVDDQVGPGANRGWVTTLVSGVKLGLGERLGRADSFSLWLDRQLAGNKPLTAEIRQLLRDSALLLVILSPGYVKSDWCGLEVQAFLAGMDAPEKEQGRVFIVERLQLDGAGRPAGFPEAAGYRFWGADENELPRVLSPVPPVFMEALYQERLNKLVADLTGALESVNTVSRKYPAKASGGGSSRDSVAAGGSQPDDRVEALSIDLRAPEKAVGLFVGIGGFDRRSHLSNIRFAPDDAVALAYQFVLRLQLIAPGRARLALSGEPSSDRAKGMLTALTSAGVPRIPASRMELLYALDELADLAQDPGGLATLSFSTHGFDEGEIAYLMPADGSRRYVAASGISVTEIQNRLHALQSPNKLLIIDACRASLSGDSRGDASANTRFQEFLSSFPGPSLLASCGLGQLSYESPEFEQGVFTHFLVDALKGAAPANPDNGVISLDEVFSYALQRTTEWVRRNIRAEQIPWRGGTELPRALPLAISLPVKEQKEKHRRLLADLASRKMQALNLLLTARTHAENRSLLTATLQTQIENSLELLSGDPLEELLEMLAHLSDVKPSSCKLFLAWWMKQREGEFVRPDKTASAEAPWTNSLEIHFVPLDGVLFGIWPVRIRDFQAFVMDTSYDASTGVYSLEGTSWLRNRKTWMNPGFPVSPAHPVGGVSWEDADAFCRWLTLREQRERHIGPTDTYRLPSDDEWSMAVGLGRYPWGETWPPPPDAGCYRTNTGTAGPGAVQVGSYAANARGVHDLGGNVWEWCGGWYQKEMNPEDLRREYPYLDSDGEGQRYRFMRGGSWYNDQSKDLRSDYRNFANLPNVRFTNVGFRCVLETCTGKRASQPFHP